VQLANAQCTGYRESGTATIDKLKPGFPHGLRAVYPFDTTPFVRARSKRW